MVNKNRTEIKLQSLTTSAHFKAYLKQMKLLKNVIVSQIII